MQMGVQSHLPSSDVAPLERYDSNFRNYKHQKGDLPQRHRLPCVKGGFRHLPFRRYARLLRPHPALACHLPHPGEGFLRLSVKFQYSAGSEVAQTGVVHKRLYQPKAFPRVGKVARQRRMRAKRASVLT